MNYFILFQRTYLLEGESESVFIHREPRREHARCYDVTLEWFPSNCCQGRPALSADGTQGLAERHIESDSVVESWLNYGFAVSLWRSQQHNLRNPNPKLIV